MRHIPDMREPRHAVTAPSRAENAALYSCQPSMVALTQAFMEERADPDALLCAVNPREHDPFEPFALLVCSAYIDLRRAMPAVSIPPWRAMLASHAPKIEDEA